MKNYPDNKRRYSALDPYRSPFEDFFRSFFSGGSDSALMKTDLYEADNAYHMDVDMPGFDKSEINLDYNDGTLTVSASHSEKEEAEGYVRRERSGSCSRSFYVGEIDAEKASASYENGTLHLVLPKLGADKQGKKIIVK